METKVVIFFPGSQIYKEKDTKMGIFFFNFTGRAGGKPASINWGGRFLRKPRLTPGYTQIKRPKFVPFHLRDELFNSKKD